MNSIDKIDKRFKDLIKIKNTTEKIKLSTEIMHLRIMNEISILMNNRSIKKRQLAEKLNVSKSYITQLFTADKIINLKLLTQIQDAFDVTFNISLNLETNICLEPPKIVADATLGTISDYNYKETYYGIDKKENIIKPQLPYVPPTAVTTPNPNDIYGIAI